MNYLTEIKLFYDWLETHDLTPSGIALWHALMFIANRCGWKEEFAASNSILESRTQMPRTTIYRARKRLQSFGLIDVFPQGSNNSSLYTLHSLKGVLAFQNNGQNETQNETHNETQPAENGNYAFQSAFQSETPILNYTDLLKKKENKKRKKNGSASSKKGKEKSSAKKEKEKAFSIDQWVKTIDSPWRELMLLWLEYKRVRKESYRSEIGAKSCLTRLKKLSGENPAIAQQIIETSMANNWAGLFELKQPSASRPQYGQRIGQIIQSDDQARRQRMMEKLRNAGNNKPDNND